jgi:hypothetical protein
VSASGHAAVLLVWAAGTAAAAWAAAAAAPAHVEAAVVLPLWVGVHPIVFISNLAACSAGRQSGQGGGA